MFQLKGSTSKLLQLPTNAIGNNPAQPRKTFDEEELTPLMDSIQSNGLIQPLIVREIAKGCYQLIAGERRLRACKMAGVKTVPAVVVQASDSQAAVMALLENIQRKSLNCFEEAAALKALIYEWNISQSELAQRIGKSQSYIANKLRLLYFSAEQQKYFLEKGLNERQCRALINLHEQDKLYQTVDIIVQKQLNTQQTEKYIAHENEPPLPQQKIKYHIKDLRIFFNTIHKAVEVMNQAGIAAVAQRKEMDGSIEYTIRIPLKEEQQA